MVHFINNAEVGTSQVIELWIRPKYTLMGNKPFNPYGAHQAMVEMLTEKVYGTYLGKWKVVEGRGSALGCLPSHFTLTHVLIATFCGN